jgi:hypothetical protein
MKLGEFENSRVFHAPKGNTKYVRDVVVTQVTKVIPEEPKIEEVKVEEPIVEPKIEEVKVKEPTREEPKVIKSPKPISTRAKKNKNEKS